jgi:hypothetical protein
MLLAGQASGQTFTLTRLVGTNDPTPTGGIYTSFFTPALDGGRVVTEARSRTVPTDGSVPQGQLHFISIDIPTGAITNTVGSGSVLSDGSGDIFAGGGNGDFPTFALWNERLVLSHQFSAPPFSPATPTDMVMVIEPGPGPGGPLEVIVKEFETIAPGSGGRRFDLIGQPDFDADQVVFIGSGEFTGFAAIYATLPGDPTSLRIVADTNTLPPEGINGADTSLLDMFTEASISSRGDVAFFEADLNFGSGRRGILAEVEGQLRSVAQRFDVAATQYPPGTYVFGTVQPGTVFTWAEFGDPVFDATGENIVFNAFAGGTPLVEPEGLYIYNIADRTIRPIIDGLTIIPDFDDGETPFHTVADNGAAAGGDGRIFFSASEFTGTTLGFDIYFYEDGRIRPLVRRNEIIDGRMVRSALVQRQGAQGDRVAFRLDFTDSTSAIYVAAFSDPCPADTNGDGLVTPTDFSAWVAAFNSRAPACDQNGDGACTATDFSAWVGNFNAGCP